jgi:hypothetical protein
LLVSLGTFRSNNGPSFSENEGSRELGGKYGQRDPSRERELRSEARCGITKKIKETTARGSPAKTDYMREICCGRENKGLLLGN